mgnify:CR=1 FL=1
MKKYFSLCLIFILSFIINTKVLAASINLSDLSNIKTYEQSDFNTFLNDYNNNNLDDIYITKFLFDGVGMYKPYDLDDFIESGNDFVVEPLEITVINLNSLDDTTFTGELSGGMIAVNTNNKSGNINIILNNVKLDTDSKKIPVIYIYNKDITSTNVKVTIKTLENTNNYLEGGKLKKVSLMPSDGLSSYTNKYSGTNSTNFTSYTNYYGVYNSSQIKKILFATVNADNEDLSDGDPVNYYKASGAISSDIDLYFEGTGYLEVTSKNKEGVETKGNLTFSGGTGDYVINAQDDCLNTTTDSKEINNARNTLTIDVNSMYAIVSLDADEGDAIDSNGTLIINGGTIVAASYPGSDAGIDSENGIFINGGTVLATGDMYDQIMNTSKQNYMVFSFNSSIEEDTLITMLDSSNNPIFSYKTDRTYTNLIYSNSNLSGTYYLYKDGSIKGNNTNGFYTKISKYTKGTMLGYSNTGVNMGGPTMNRNNNQAISTSSNEFKVDAISNQFSGISEYSNTNNILTSNSTINAYLYIGIGIIVTSIILLIILILIRRKNTKEVA